MDVRHRIALEAWGLFAGLFILAVWLLLFALGLVAAWWLFNFLVGLLFGGF